MPQPITLQVNGHTHHLHIEPQTPLLYVLRNDLGLKAAKFACGLAQCGACNVIIDGRARPSCRLPVGSVQGREITTLEGLGSANELHPLQQAFIQEGAVQCGYCTPGMIVSAAALLERNPQPSDDEIRAALAGNLCRCGVYHRAFRAIRRAAGRPAPPRDYGQEFQGERQLQPAPSDALPYPLTHTPDLDSWVRVNHDGTITLFTGKVELGQDIRTSFAMIGADELDVSLERIRVVMADTEQSPDEGYTVSSMSLETSGNAIRYAAAEARRILLSMAFEELQTPVERLTVSDGLITDPVSGRSVSYWELFAGQRFRSQVQGLARPKEPGEYKIVGQPTPRLDLLDKVTGRARFVQDLDLPDMVHGRVLRPPGYRARLVSVDEDAARNLPGVIQILRDGSFLGVVAEREEQATSAIEALRQSAAWEDETHLPPHETLVEHMLSQPDQAFLVVDGTSVEGPVPPIKAPDAAAQTLQATYFRPYHMHASQGPSAALAQLVEGKLTVWTHSQGVYPLRAELAQVLDLPQAQIHAVHVDGAGCFGHNGADDAALDAALLARAAPGRPVMLKWTRRDENTWEPYGPAALIKMQGSLDAAGDVIDWNHDVWGYTHIGRARPGTGESGLLAAWHLARPWARPQAQPILGHQAGIHRNAEPLYAFARRRIVKHFVPAGPLRTSTLRGLGSYANVFAIESFMDELAHAAGADPLEFRLRYLQDERARAVIEAAAARAGWGDGVRGRGLAFAQYKNRQVYAAVVVELHVDRASGHIHLQRAVVAADVGQIVNPDSLSNQLEGAFTQSASWTLKEQVTFDRRSVISLDWRSYPILRFNDAPAIETVLLNRPSKRTLGRFGLPYLGVGEGAQGPVPAAIANAVFDAVGVRLRQIPFTPERVKAALAKNGKIRVLG